MKLRPQPLGHSDSSLTREVYTHIASEDDKRFAEQLDVILCSNAPEKENGSGVVTPKPLYLN
jgi:hypothetical protein